MLSLYPGYSGGIPHSNSDLRILSRLDFRGKYFSGVRLQVPIFHVGDPVLTLLHVGEQTIGFVYEETKRLYAGSTGIYLNFSL